MTMTTMSSVSVRVLDDLVDRVVDVLGGVVGDTALHAGGQLLLDILQLGADALHDVERVRVRQHPDAHEDGLLSPEKRTSES